MIQGGRPLPREFFNARENGWQERSFLDISQDNRFSGTQSAQPNSIHPRCLPVEAALKDCAGLSVKEFALFVVDDNGDEKAYTSTSLTPHQQRIFTERFKADFRRSTQRAAQTPYAHSGYIPDETDPEKDLRSRYSTSGESSSEGPRRFQRQSRSEDTDDDSASGRLSRKRPRPQYTDNDDTPVPIPVIKTQQLAIGDDVEVDKFYNVRFKDMQQSSCKIMGKAFVKLIEPKKQTHHPYTKGAAKAPPWWPATTGENHVRHREPDHLLKPERIRLLIHILKMIVEPPSKQCSTVQKLGLNVKKLEEVTLEAMSNWFNDKDHPENGQKKPFLKEIFKVARGQERYKNGEIDGTTRIPVQFGDRGAQDNSDDDDPDEGIKDEDEESEALPGSNGIPPSESMISGPMIQSQHLQQETDFFRHRPIPVRYHTQPQAQIEEQNSFNDSYISRNMNVNFQHISPPVQEPNRRGFASSSYQSSQPNMYTWQNNMVTNSSPSNFYVTSPQSSLPAQSNPYQLPPPNSQQNMLPLPMAQSSYDGLPSGRYDPGTAPIAQLRTGSLGNPHPHTNHASGFPDYLQENSYAQNEPEMKHDQHMHSS